MYSPSFIFLLGLKINMARISGVNIPTNKRVLVALTYIYGIGTKIAGEICDKASIDISKRVNQLTDEETKKGWKENL